MLIHAALNAYTVVVGSVETILDRWGVLGERQRGDLIRMAESQAEHARNLLTDCQQGPVVRRPGPERRGEPPYFVLLREAVRGLDAVAVTVRTLPAESPDLDFTTRALLHQAMAACEGMTDQLHQLLRRLAAGLTVVLDEL